MRNRKVVGCIELILGILLILLGIYSFVNPISMMAGVTVIYGVFALVTGAADIIYYIRLERRTRFAPVFSLVGGILSVLMGILILCNIAAGIWVLVILFPIWFIAHCAARLAHLPYVRMVAGNGYYYFTLAVNILGLILGFLMIMNPAVSLFSLSYLAGLYLLCLGIDSLVFAVNLLGRWN